MFRTFPSGSVRSIARLTPISGADRIPTEPDVLAHLWPAPVARLARPHDAQALVYVACASCRAAISLADAATHADGSRICLLCAAGRVA